MFGKGNVHGQHPQKLGSRPGSNAYILNELGVGYRMIDEDNDTHNRENLE